MTRNDLIVATTSGHELMVPPPTDPTGLLAATVSEHPGWPSGKEIVMAVGAPDEASVKPAAVALGEWCFWLRGACFTVLAADARRIANWLAQVQGVRQ